MEISKEKTRILAFLGKEPIPTDVCLDNRILILERINTFTYFGNRLSYEVETYATKTQNKLKQWE